MAAAMVTLSSAQSLFKCVGSDGHVSYQQRPCVGSGKAIDATPANEEVKPATSVAVPVPKASRSPTSSGVASANSVTTDVPGGPPPQAKGRLDGWPHSGDGLVQGMSPSAVIKSWGRPHSISIIDGKAVF